MFNISFVNKIKYYPGRSPVSGKCENLENCYIWRTAIQAKAMDKNIVIRFVDDWFSSKLNQLWL